MEDGFENLCTELRRGSLTLMTLGSLRTPHYGYLLLSELKEKGVDIEANTLYPLMRRLEERGYLTSSWDTTESRPRKYYALSDEGRQVLRGLMEQWRMIARQVTEICDNEENEYE